MLLTQFILQNFHFGLNVFAALVFFAVFWLYLDAWRQTKKTKDFLKILGFIFLSLSFLTHAVYIEQTAISSLLRNDLIENAANVINLLGYLFLVLGLILDPIQKKPIQPKEVVAPAGFLIPQAQALLSFALVFPFLSFVIFLLLLIRSTKGLENHLKPLTVGFLFIFLYDFLSLSKLFEQTTNINIFNLVKPFGSLWLMEHALLLLGVLIIAKWIFTYLLKRIQTQLFMIINVLVLAIFVAVTVSFTGLLLSNLQQDALSHLASDVSVVKYAILAKQNESLSDAEVVSQNPALQSAILSKDKEVLKTLSTSILLAKKQSYLIIVDTSGRVLMRGEDNEKIGDSLSEDELFLRAMRGEKSSSIVIVDGAVAPTVSIRSSVPILDKGKLIGIVIVGTDIDSAFVDGFKESTKLNISVYAGNVLSATTFVAPDGKSRYIGIKESSDKLNTTVLNENKNYSSTINILNVPYLAVFAPLDDVKGNPVGMLFVGKEQVSVIRAAAASIEYTFIISAILILLSVFPSLMISKYISKQFI